MAERRWRWHRAAMPVIAPLTSYGSRDVEKKPRPVPKAVRDAIVMMVYGKPDEYTASVENLPDGYVRCRDARKLSGKTASFS